jgi:hypothetical protein
MTHWLFWEFSSTSPRQLGVLRPRQPHPTSFSLLKWDPYYYSWVSPPYCSLWDEDYLPSSLAII